MGFKFIFEITIVNAKDFRMAYGCITLGFQRSNACLERVTENEEKEDTRIFIQGEQKKV